ncbi:hypothetical protein [Paenibacillus sp. FSL H7-0331]|nr:hypothetical protein [Paenibacillus sp. FSL H7-0331]
MSARGISGELIQADNSATLSPQANPALPGFKHLGIVDTQTL